MPVGHASGTRRPRKTQWNLWYNACPIRSQNWVPAVAHLVDSTNQSIPTDRTTIPYHHDHHYRARGITNRTESNATTTVSPFPSSFSRRWWMGRSILPERATVVACRILRRWLLFPFIDGLQLDSFPRSSGFLRGFISNRDQRVSPHTHWRRSASILLHRANYKVRLDLTTVAVETWSAMKCELFRTTTLVKWLFFFRDLRFCFATVSMDLWVSRIRLIQCSYYPLWQIPSRVPFGTQAAFWAWCWPSDCSW